MPASALKTTITLRRFHTPMNSESIRGLIGKLMQATSEQKTAATLATSLMSKGVATHPGKIRAIWLTLGPAQPASGESMVFDVLKNGASILTSAYTHDSTTNTGLVDLMFRLDATKQDIAVGDKLEVSRTYVAGGGPTPMTHSRVDVEWAPNSDP